MNTFHVVRTENEDRKKSKDDYIVCVNPDTKEKLFLGKFAVITKYSEEIRQTLHVHCRVITDVCLSPKEIKLDETLRTSLGFPTKYEYEKHTVEVYPLDLNTPQLLNEYLSHLLGRRYLFLRVFKADSIDMDKKYARVASEAIKVLGTTEGNNLILENTVKKSNCNRYLLKRSSIQVYEFTQELSNKRIILESKCPDRFPSPEKVLPVEQDIWSIYFDSYVRSEIGIKELHTLKVRRDLLSIFLKEFREFGILFFLSSFTISALLPDEVDRTWELFTLISMIALMISLFLTLVNIRERVV